MLSKHLVQASAATDCSQNCSSSCSCQLQNLPLLLQHVSERSWSWRECVGSYAPAIAESIFTWCRKVVRAFWQLYHCMECQAEIPSSGALSFSLQRASALATEGVFGRSILRD